MSNSTSQKLARSLEVNQTIQKELKEKLRSIHEAKRTNRQTATRQLALLYDLYEEHLNENKPSIDRIDNNFSFKIFAENLNKLEAERKEKCLEIDDEDDAKPKSTSTKGRKRKRTNDDSSATKETEQQENVGASAIKKHTAESLKKLWSMNEEKDDWSLHYFVDPFGSIPQPNKDAMYRKKLEACNTNNPAFSPDGTLFWVNWSKAEDKLLKKIVQEVCDEEKAENSHQGGSSKRPRVRGKQATKQPSLPAKTTSMIETDIKFDEVASRFNKQTQAKIGRQFESTQTYLVHRTKVECRNRYLYHVSPKINHSSKWTEEESDKLFEIARTHGHSNLRWDRLAIELDTNRTPWQCFKYYQAHINKSSIRIKWSPTEDELLFKYLVLKGPQYQISADDVSEICKTILPHRSKREVRDRALRSLLNPAFVNEPWSSDDERRFVMLMKVYRDDPNPLGRLVDHFPYRSSSSIREKWTRSLNPEFSLRPWTKEEDDLLLATVQKQRDEHGVAWDWSSIAAVFSNRRARTLHHRWVEIVDEKTLVQQQSDALHAKKSQNILVGGNTNIMKKK